MVMVFGVFDGLHPGHFSFLRQAKKYGKRLVVVVAPDRAVSELKRKMPRQNQLRRMSAVRKIKAVTSAVLGDRTQGSYRVVRKYKPDVICLGYDQRKLAKDLRKKMGQGIIPRVKLIRLKSYYPKKFHSSLR